MKDRRWDVDERGHGVADGSALANGVHELGAALTIRDWVAEEPEVHLPHHIERACRELGLDLLGHSVEDAIFVVRIARPSGLRPAETRAAVFSVVGTFAESATSVRERGSSFKIVTGMLDPDTPFKAHGHLVRLELVPHE